MIPSVVASQIKNCVADYLRTTFHPTTSGFENLIHHFLQTPNQYYRGPYINIGLPFRPSDRQGEPFPEIPLGFQPPPTSSDRLSTAESTQLPIHHCGDGNRVRKNGMLFITDSRTLSATATTTWHQSHSDLSDERLGNRSG